MTDPEATTVLEQSEAIDGGIMQTIQRRDGSEIVIRIDDLAAFAVLMIDEEDHEHKMGWQLKMGWYQDQFKQLRWAVEKAIRAASPQGQAK